MKKTPTNTTEETSRDPEKFLAEGILFGGSNAIERQEARGQQELVNLGLSGYYQNRNYSLCENLLLTAARRSHNIPA